MNKMGITVLIATYNRSEILRNTLSSFLNLELRGLEVEFVIIDNNSSDDTAEAVEYFSNKLPLVYLFESRPGKNCALNKALNEIELKELVVFTDDDVKPNPDWLGKIIDVSYRWPEICVFGGQIYPIWACNPPEWIEKLPEKLLSFAYAVHNHGDNEIYYENGYPFGPNYWVRSSIFRKGLRFDESIGPIPDNKKRIMGSELSLLMYLKRIGYSILYSPGVIVGHHISPYQCTEKYILKRAETSGRSIAILASTFKNETIYKRSHLLWQAYRTCSLIKHIIIKYILMCCRNNSKIFSRRINAQMWISCNRFYLKNHKKLYEKILISINSNE